MVLLLFSNSINAQTSFQISDSRTGELLYRVIVSENDQFLGFSDLQGKFTDPKIRNSAVSYQFKLYGYRDSTVQIESPSSTLLEVKLQPTSKSLTTLVVSGTKYIQPLELQSVSIDVVKAEDLQRKITPDLARAAERLSGVNILDGQASIRGGSGYAYGAGSRVLLVVDNQPLVTADRNDIKWNYIPLELTDQIEVVKGASSVQYGASALNGVIHLRTMWPDSIAQTRVSTFGSVTPESNGPLAWWGKSLPYQSGVQFSHMFKTKNNIDVVLGGNGLKSTSWLNGEYEERVRMCFKVRKRFNKGKFALGLDGNIMRQKSGFFLFWKNDSTEAFQPFSDGISLDFNDLWLNIDPWAIWFDKANNKHSLRTRYFGTYQVGSDNWQPATHIFNADYQYQADVFWNMSLLAGLSSNYFRFRDDALGGLHTGNFAGAYLQLDKSIGRFQVTAGWRYEIFRLDTFLTKSIPVQHYGVNFRASKNLFLRGSFAEGFRFPSPAERFVKYQIDIINIYPNPDLLPEQGWNAELGIKRKFVKDQWTGYIDLAAFVTSYDNMTEFSFGKWGKPNSPLFGAGFKSVNLTRALIGGLELSVFSEGKIKGHDLSIVGGYTYITPVDLSASDSLAKIGPFLKYAINSFNEVDASPNSPVLRYRYRHMVKLNADLTLKNGISFGAGFRSYSFMEKIDTVLALIVPGLAKFRAENTGFSVIADLRVGYQFKSDHKISFHVLNFTNSFVTIRPAKPEAPRTFVLQLSSTIRYRKKSNAN
jgi:outer membrane receptor protein involved in Fe transport